MQTGIYSRGMRQMKNYYFPLFLIISIIAGSITGYVMGAHALVLKPLGDIFLNLLFTVVVPLVFFSISSAVAHMGQLQKIFRIISAMFFTFIFTGIIAAIFMICVVAWFPPAQGIILKLKMPEAVNSIHLAEQIVNMLSVSDFSQLLSHKNMLPLILFSFLIGLATASIQEKGRPFALFLQSGTEVLMKIISYILYYAPIGFFAYFAVLVGELGPQILQNYLRVFVIYYFAASIYFVLAFTFYAFLAGGKSSIKLFWANIFIPMVTAFATCSSAASIPANLQASRAMQVRPEIYETLIPLGAILHKDGSVLGAIIKIAFLMGIFGMSFNTPQVWLTALGLALLVGMVMGAIPSGGMLGEILILSFYGFPPQALLIIAAISLIIDPLATMLNVTGDTVCSMMVDRMVDHPPSEKA
jgi:Na+/H+-dicarboxylate symporter